MPPSDPWPAGVGKAIEGEWVLVNVPLEESVRVKAETCVCVCVRVCVCVCGRGSSKKLASGQR